MTKETPDKSDVKNEEFEMDDKVAVTEPMISGDGAKVKVVPAAVDQENGEANIEMPDDRKQGVAMNKSELMRYANDPFWVRLRMFLFILFWIVLLGMLVVSLVIIVLTPKCVEVLNQTQNATISGVNGTLQTGKPLAQNLVEAATDAVLKSTNMLVKSN